MQPPLQFRVPKTKLSDCRFDYHIITLQDFLFPLFLGATAATGFTEPVTETVPHLLRQYKNCYRVFLRTRLIIPRIVSIWPSLLSKYLKFHFFRQKTGLKLFLLTLVHILLDNQLSSHRDSGEHYTALSQSQSSTSYRLHNSTLFSAFHTSFSTTFFLSIPAFLALFFLFFFRKSNGSPAREAFPTSWRPLSSLPGWHALTWHHVASHSALVSTNETSSSWQWTGLHTQKQTPSFALSPFHTSPSSCCFNSLQFQLTEYFS